MYQIDESSLKKIIENNSVNHFTEVSWTCYKSIVSFFNDSDYGDIFINDDIIKRVPFDDFSKYKDLDILSYIRKDLKEIRDEFYFTKPDPDLIIAMDLLNQYNDSNKEDPFAHRKWMVNKLGSLISKSKVGHCDFKKEDNTIDVDLLGELNAIINIRKLNKTENLIIFEDGPNTIFVNKNVLKNSKSIINKLNEDYINAEIPKLDSLINRLLSSDEDLMMTIPKVINEYAQNSVNIKDNRTFRLLSELKSSLEKSIIIGNAEIKEDKNTLKRRRL